LLQLKIERLQLERDIELQNKELTEEEKFALEQKFLEDSDQLRRDSQAKQVKSYQDRISEIAGLIQTGIQTLVDFSRIKTDKEIQDADNEKDAKVKALDEELAEKKISQEQYNKKKAEIEKNAERQIAELKTKQAQKEKAAQIAQATIAMALAIVKALPNFGAAAIAGIMGALQIAKIVATPIPQVATGGSTERALPRGKGALPTVIHGGYIDQPLIAEFGEKGPEYVIPNWMMNDPMVANWVGIMEGIRTGRSGGSLPGFAEGGPTVGSAQANASSSGEALMMLVAQVGALVSKLNSWSTQLTAVISYDQIEDAINTVSEIRDESKIQ
jgi:hypothetical protein